MPGYTPTKPTRVRVNPSRRTCEEIIRRILVTENQQNGTNRHFKTGADFMTYFESLFPSGPALTKQVQRAIRSMGLAKDANGYFLINKTKEEQAQERELAALLDKTHATITETGSYETLLVTCEPAYRSYLLTLFAETDSLRDLYLTIIETVNGLLFLTPDAEALRTAVDGIWM